MCICVYVCIYIYIYIYLYHDCPSRRGFVLLRTSAGGGLAGRAGRISRALGALGGPGGPRGAPGASGGLCGLGPWGSVAAGLWLARLGRRRDGAAARKLGLLPLWVLRLRLGDLHALPLRGPRGPAPPGKLVARPPGGPGRAPPRARETWPRRVQGQQGRCSARLPRAAARHRPPRRRQRGWRAGARRRGLAAAEGPGELAHGLRAEPRPRLAHGLLHYTIPCKTRLA